MYQRWRFYIVHKTYVLLHIDRYIYIHICCTYSYSVYLQNFFMAFRVSCFHATVWTFKRVEVVIIFEIFITYCHKRKANNLMLYITKKIGIKLNKAIPLSADIILNKTIWDQVLTCYKKFITVPCRDRLATVDSG